MSKIATDSRQLRLNRMGLSRFSHLKLLVGWVFYFISHTLTESLIPQERCHVIQCGLDEMIPFCEWFFIPYAFWYLMVIAALAFFGLRDADNFKRLQTYIIITQVVATAVYVLYPNCQLLRPEQFPRDNVLTDCVRGLYTIDTNTGVCPSLHCAYSIAITSVCMRAKSVSKGWKWSVLIASVIICMSTVFIKQHSALDFFAALPVCLLAEVLVYKVFFPKKEA